MKRQPIAVKDLVLQPFTAFDPEGVLLVCGKDAQHANPMTISWGAFGIMWGKPILMVMVRPSRHTFNLITKAPDFTVNWMGPEWSEALNVCGSASGRDMDKFSKTKLHPVKAAAVKSPVIDESILAVECRIAYRGDVDPKRFLDPSLLKCYDAKDYHGLFFGEVVAISGTSQFKK